MFHRQTLFVVGAGASFELDLPLGTALAKSIKQKMDIRFGGPGNKPIGTGDMDLFENVTKFYVESMNEFQDAAWLMRDGLGLLNQSMIS
jgi:hypothetical protein